MKLNLMLVHDGERWIAKNGDFFVAGKTLEELDENLKTELKKRMGDLRGKKIEVRMEYDYRGTFPSWITQYHPYYLHRVIHVEL
ncbi:DUF5395 family protein [Archaeoglobus veneficus]|uniref:Uncharacterized protein n=1 Tax=Archaeoglobus veneficus (strain DSM 11195 / SNP6) TaxID=693661 RepID=F2KMJ1_ARCVS|nr:DUF5395 family protein [Archaeoglobus veneficus]AEA47188.1 hypothetical protein Arcve_1180 [Archaeoglobus veneficus SNP6]